jgi:hypothetical protein
VEGKDNVKLTAQALKLWRVDNGDCAWVQVDVAVDRVFNPVGWICTKKINRPSSAKVGTMMTANNKTHIFSLSSKSWVVERDPAEIKSDSKGAAAIVHREKWIGGHFRHTSPLCCFGHSVNSFLSSLF